MPIWAVFVIGLFQDLLTGSVIGPGIVGLLIAHALVVWQLRFFLAASFSVVWVAFMLVAAARSEEHTSELQSLMRISYAVFCLKKQRNTQKHQTMRTKIHCKHNINNHI